MACRECEDGRRVGPDPCPRCGEPGAALVHAGPALVAEAGAGSGRAIPIPAAGLRIGREPGAGGLVLNDPEISRFHALIEPVSGGGMVLEDHSVNGTYIDGMRIQRQLLRHDDQIRFGLRELHTYRYQEAVNEAAVGGRLTDVLFRGHAGAAAAAVPGAFLELISHQTRADTLALAGASVVVGSGHEATHLVVSHYSVAPRHCELARNAAGRWSVRDLKTASGTFVNGRRVDEWVLRDRDVIQLGECENHCLVFRSPGAREAGKTRYPVPSGITRVGRDGSNEVTLDHPTVSRFHARIERSGTQTRLVDLSSTNGTFVDGERVSESVLRAGSRILLGGVPLDFDGTALELAVAGSELRLSCHGIFKSVLDTTTDLPLTLLDEVSLELEPGELVGLLGPSGSGKSTLLDALNGSRPADRGQVLINHWNLYRNYAALKHLLGYVPQDDILHRGLTVGRTLYFSARLRLPSDLSEAEIGRRVDEVLEMLDLTERREVRVAQLSGGQRKRVSLGIELLSKPGILFLDEPTAGQDPRTEMKMMQLFREIANSGTTVILTTHLMGSLGLLDRAAVLVRGQLVYQGAAASMLPYFGGTQPHEMYERLQEKSPREWVDLYRESGMAVAGEAAESAVAAPAPGGSQAAPRRWADAMRQFSTLCRRQWELRMGRASALLSAMAAPIGIGLLTGAVKDGPNEPKVLFIMIFAALWFGGSSAVREIVDEADIYRRERQRNLSLGAYLASKLVYGAGLGAAQSLVFVLVLAVCGALTTHLLTAWLLLSVVTFEGTLIGLLISAMVGSSEQALAIFPLALIPQLLLAGLFMPVRTIHPFYPRWNAQQARVEIVDLPAAMAAPAMSPWLRDTLAAVMAGRWGLEALADQYVHDNQPYSLQILNAMSITLHPRDAERARQMLRSGSFQGAQPAPVKSSLPGYLAILGALAAGVAGATAAGLKRKDGKT